MLKIPEFLDNEHEVGKVVSLKLLPPLPAEDIPGTNFYWVDQRTIVRLEVLCQWKITIKPSGIETAAFGLVVQFLKATV